MVSSYTPAVLGAVRAISARADAFHAEHERLRPPGTAYALGSDYWLAMLKRDVLRVVLRHLGRGATAAEAGAAARAEAREYVRIWNARPQALAWCGRPETLHLWEGTADPVIDWAVSQLEPA